MIWRGIFCGFGALAIGSGIDRHIKDPSFTLKFGSVTIFLFIEVKLFSINALIRERDILLHFSESNLSSL